ncbi:hypothetical protein MAR_004581 [Mya arenaria]|uniref:Uncharacterized protein n=1 Tax=Mya arenaria TaxID=6604 RepID=A0ABY7F071_MYAAR|nr:hypothetical protein MAR_004581 [Mya arenaria]
MSSELPDNDTENDESQSDNLSLLDEELDNLGVTEDETSECICEEPELGYDDECETNVHDYLMSIYDLSGMEYTTIRVECTPVWDQERIENDRVPEIDYFEDVIIVSETVDDPDVSLQDCFVGCVDDDDEMMTRTMQVLHSPEDELPANVICSYLERGKTFLCLPMTEKDPSFKAASLLENSKILDKTLIIVTEHATLDFLSTVKALLKHTEVKRSLSVMLISLSRWSEGAQALYWNTIKCICYGN